MKHKTTDWLCDYKSPGITLIDINVEGVLCASDMLEGFMNEDDIQFIS